VTRQSAIAGIRFRLASARQAIVYGRKPCEEAYGQAILFDEHGNRIVRETARRRDPFMVARLGFGELMCISYFLRWRRLRAAKLPYPQSVRRAMIVNAGVFPADDAHLDRFAAAFLAAVSQTDVMAVWLNRNEPRILETYCPTAQLVQLACLEPWHYSKPWSAELAEKVVLVVHPFAQSIESQYREHRQRLFPNPSVLPSFELKTLRAVQSIAGHSAGFTNWFDALAHMCDQISREQYDIAIIGAGAYGLPLAAFVKSQGRQAVHMGGATQILFGIKGRRWEVDPWHSSRVGGLFNESWVRPLPEETPERSDLIENGCYW
jgi:hypothetical protein